MRDCNAPERTEKAGKGFVTKTTCIEPGIQKLMLMLENVPLILSKRQLKTTQGTWCRDLEQSTSHCLLFVELQNERLYNFEF